MSEVEGKIFHVGKVGEKMSRALVLGKDPLYRLGKVCNWPTMICDGETSTVDRFLNLGNNCNNLIIHEIDGKFKFIFD